jgi:hypothetical protein
MNRTVISGRWDDKVSGLPNSTDATCFQYHFEALLPWPGLASALAWRCCLTRYRPGLFSASDPEARTAITLTLSAISFIFRPQPVDTGLAIQRGYFIWAWPCCYFCLLCYFHFGLFLFQLNPELFSPGRSTDFNPDPGTLAKHLGLFVRVAIFLFCCTRLILVGTMRRCGLHCLRLPVACAFYFISALAVSAYCCLPGTRAGMPGYAAFTVSACLYFACCRLGADLIYACCLTWYVQALFRRCLPVSDPDLDLSLVRYLFHFIPLTLALCWP